MYRMIIVDDLPAIVDRMARLIGSKLGQRLELLQAYSGQEALRIVMNAPIDLVLTDIRMPGMDGLELLKEIRKHRSQCKVIFLTSYNEFQYAKEAISGGGFDFLLKFDSDSAIIRSVEKAIAAIDGEYETKNLLQEAEQRKQQLFALLQEQLANDLLSGSLEMSRLADLFCEMKIGLSADCPVFVLIARVDESIARMPLFDRKMKLNAMRSRTSDLLSGLADVMSVVYGDAQIVWLLQPQQACEMRMAGESPEAIGAKTSAALSESLESIQSACRDIGKLSLILSPEPVEWNDLKTAFDSLQSLLQQRAASDKEARPTNRSAQEIKEQAMPKAIVWLNDYIREHLGDDLSMTRLAEIVNLNPSYLSRLYIQSTGTAISDYIQALRLDKAKELLGQTRFKVYEIAGQLGYDSALSFVRFFKKNMQMTPQEYRESTASSNDYRSDS